jgi:HSP20 family protein
MNLIPWRERNSMQLLGSDAESWLEEAVNQAFGIRGNMLPELFRRALPPVNLASDDKDFVASIELPGLEENDVQVQIMGKQLVISGERKWDEEKKESNFYRLESQFGAFKRVVPLPDGLKLDTGSITAKLSKGMLEIRIPKLEPRPAEKIKVTSGK